MLRFPVSLSSQNQSPLDLDFRLRFRVSHPFSITRVTSYQDNVVCNVDRNMV